MGNPPHQAGLSILRSWPNDRNVGRTRIALIGGTREGKSPMLDVQNLQRPDPNHPPTDYLIPLRNKMKIRAKKFGECEATNFVTSNKLCWFVWTHEKTNSKSRGVHQRYMPLKPVNDQIYDSFVFFAYRIVHYSRPIFIYFLDWKTYLKYFNLFYLWSLYHVDLVLESPTMVLDRESRNKLTNPLTHRIRRFSKRKKAVLTCTLHRLDNLTSVFCCSLGKEILVGCEAGW